MSSAVNIRPLQIVSRVAAGIVGGWAFTWGFVSLGIALLLLAGMSYADAKTLSYLLAFLVFLVAFCWSFTAASALRAWSALILGAVTTTSLAWWLTRVAA